VNIAIVWLETARNHHQSLQTLIFVYISHITTHNSNAIEAHY